MTPSPGRADALRGTLEGRLAAGYEQLFVLTPVELAALILSTNSPGVDPLDSVLGARERFAMLLERIDELSLQRHDFGGSANALLAGFIRRIDRLKAHLVGAEDYARWAAGLNEGGHDRNGVDGEPADVALELEFADVYRAHERMLAESAVLDAGDLVRDALRAVRERPTVATRFDHVLLDDGHELDPAPRALTRELGGPALTSTADPLRGGVAPEAERTITLERSVRCPERVTRAAYATIEAPPAEASPGGEVVFWRCANDRAQAQSVAGDIERLTAREGIDPGAIVVLVPTASREGQAIAVALEERAVPHRVVGEAAFFQRAEIRDLLAWLRLLTDPTDAAAAVRALARPPIDLRSVDIARVTQIARRRKLDMVAALAAATESPQVPPEARERIRVFLKLCRSGVAALDTTRPDLYVHRLIDRLGLRRHQLFAAQADVVERLRALARFGELAAAYARRAPQGTPREFARSIAAVADSGLREHDEPELAGARYVQVVAIDAAGALEADHVYVVGLHAGLAMPAPERIPRALAPDGVPPSQDAPRTSFGGRVVHGDRPGKSTRRAVLPERQRQRRGPAPGAAARAGARGARGHVGGPPRGAVRAGRDAPLDLPAAA